MRVSPTVAAYGAAVAASAAALALALALAPATGGRGGHVFVVAVALVAAVGGWRAGLLTGMLGTLAINWFFEEPVGSLRVDSVNTALNAVALLVVAGVVGGLTDRRRAAFSASEAARGELEAVLDAVDDSVIVYAADRRMVRTNRLARERLLDGWGRIPTTIDEMRAAVRPMAADGTPVTTMPSERALAGHGASTSLTYTDPDGRIRRFSVRAAPVRDGAGAVVGAVAVWHDVTEMHEAAVDLGQLDGTLKTVTRVMHELGNALAPARGYGQLLPTAAPERAARYVGQITASIERAAAILERLGRVARFAQTEFGGAVMLDLDEAARDGEQPAREGEEPTREGEEPARPAAGA